ncbi:hypothetical protein BTS2_3162 [Bacillus sp. TS-2]|nr:hypothetical protein BTS2_3162 [Bacillus sp. TS-2]
MILTMLFFVFIVGLSIGGLLAANRHYPPLFVYVFFVLYFLVSAYIGMIIGMLFPSFLIGFFITEFLVCTATFLFLIAVTLKYHPSLGFFYWQEKIVFILLGSIFFLMGFQWGIFEFRFFFTFFSCLLFGLALFIGLFIQIQMKQKFWRYPLAVFLPCIWLFLITLIKLF